MTQLSRPGRWLLSAATVLICVGGCSEDEPATEASWLPRYSGETSGDDADFSGTLTLDGDCLYVTNGSSRTLPIFPPNSSFDSKSNTLTVEGTSFRVGETFRSGGGELNPAASFNYEQPPNPACDTSNAWIVGEVRRD